MENWEVAANVIGWLHVITCETLYWKKEKRDRVLPKVYAIFRVKTKKSLRFPRTWLVFFFSFRVKVLPVLGVFFGLESTYYRWLGVDAYVHVYTLLKVTLYLYVENNIVDIFEKS